MDLAAALHRGEHDGECHGVEKDHYEVVSLQWEEVRDPFGICVWIMVASLAKLVFHQTRLHKIIPESCLLIIIGFAIGGIIRLEPEGFRDSLASGLDSDLFFLFLLPPIILEAGYFMPSRSFFDNIGTIVLYAVVGTLFNTVAIGLSLYAVSELGWYGNGPNGTLYVPLMECLTFSSIVSAVDPVAVLAVFEEVQVNEVLFILVFGESLLNDAVTVVLYRIFESFNTIGVDQLQVLDYASGLLSLFVVVFGGILIGLIYGFLTSLLTRLTRSARVIEPIFVFTMAYLAYLTAEMFHLSAILSLVCCALFMKPYVECNISHKSRTTIKYFLKMLSSICETIIFIFLGVTTLVDLEHHQWNTAFVIFTVVFCLAYRILGVVIQTRIANAFRIIPISGTEQLIMAYGGLRGAIAFSLVTLLCKDTVASKEIMYSACIIVIMVTVFIQGTTIKPLVDLLQVKKITKHVPTMNEKIFERFADQLLVGVEAVLGQRGHRHLRNRWEALSANMIEPVLVQGRRSSNIFEAFSKLSEKDAMGYIRSYGSLSSMPRDRLAHRLSVTSEPSFDALLVNIQEPGHCSKPTKTKVSKKPITGELNLFRSVGSLGDVHQPRRHSDGSDSKRETAKPMYGGPKVYFRRNSQQSNQKRSSRASFLGEAVINMRAHPSSDGSPLFVQDTACKKNLGMIVEDADIGENLGIALDAADGSHCDDIDFIWDVASTSKTKDITQIVVDVETYPNKSSRKHSITSSRLARVRPSVSRNINTADDSVPLAIAMETEHPC